MTRLLLTGADGQFGMDFQARFGDRYDISPLFESECDIRDAAAVRKAILAARPEVVVHAAAYTDVDGAEANPDTAYAVNAMGSGHVAAAAEEAGAWVLAISTDYVFSGRLGRPYHEFDRPSPLNIYGRSKLAGEGLVSARCRRYTIVRTAWLYGRTGKNFPKTIIKAARQRPALPVVEDQWGNPTSTTALAALVDQLIRHPVFGVVHGSCEGETTWFEFAREILTFLRIPCAVEPCPTTSFPRPARRPADARLDKMMLRLAGLPPMPHWRDALHEWLKENADVLT